MTNDAYNEALNNLNKIKMSYTNRERIQPVSIIESEESEEDTGINEEDYINSMLAQRQEANELLIEDMRAGIRIALKSQKKDVDELKLIAEDMFKTRFGSQSKQTNYTG